MKAKPLVIFGSGDMAELAHYYFSKDSEFTPVAFTLDREFIKNSTCCGLPVVAFEDIQNIYPPQKYSLFIALSYSKLNQLRRDKYQRAKDMGYQTPSYISSKATMLNDHCVGENCFVLEDNTVQPFVTIGDNVTLWSGNHIGHHSVIEDHTFIASHVVVSGGVKIGRQCFIGVNATLRDHIKIGDRSVIGAGVLLLKSCEPESLYVGSAVTPSSRKSTDLKKL